MSEEQKQGEGDKDQGGFRGTDTMESEKMRETGGQGGRGSQQGDTKEPLGKSRDQNKHRAGFQSPTPDRESK